jgi:hypothetical protein
MITRSLAILFILLAASHGPAFDAVKTSNTFPDEQLSVVLQNMKDFCNHLETSKTHSIYAVPKLLGSFTTIDPFSNKPEAKIDSGQSGYFLDGDAQKFVEGLKKPSEVTLYDSATTHLLIPLTKKSATAEEHVIQCFFTSTGRFIVRKRIAQFENGSADFVYEGEFAVWVKKHMLTPVP